MKITKKVIEVKFRKLRGQNPDFKTWDEFSGVERSLLLEKFHLNQEEIPVVASVHGPEPILITTTRIFWVCGREAKSLSFDQVRAVTTPQVLKIAKLDVTDLVLTDVEGDEHVLHTNPGKPLFILWNLMLKILRAR